MRFRCIKFQRNRFVHSLRVAKRLKIRAKSPSELQLQVFPPRTICVKNLRTDLSPLKNCIVEFAVLECASNKVAPQKPAASEIAILKCAEAEVACIKNCVLEVHIRELLILRYSPNHQSVAELFFAETGVKKNVDVVLSIARAWHYLGLILLIHL